MSLHFLLRLVSHPLGVKVHMLQGGEVRRVRMSFKGELGLKGVIFF